MLCNIAVSLSIIDGDYNNPFACRLHEKNRQVTALVEGVSLLKHEVSTKPSYTD